MRALPASLLLGFALLSGCMDDPNDPITDPVVPSVPSVDDVLEITLASAMNFTEAVVTAAVDFTGDLYEPTIEVSDSGVIYITGHTIAVDTTGPPVFFSRDDGATWAQLPFNGALAAPQPVQGAGPPPSDEIFLAAGDDGWLYGVDITLATFPVNAWSGDGAEHAYHNPNAYDETQMAQASTETGCVPAPAKDRPWGAYANGTLLMVSNPGAGPAQVGVLQVPPTLPAGVGAASGAQWNLCAGPGTTPASCSIPGIPDIRDDGLFAVPQLCEGALHLALGNKADVMATGIVEVFEHESGGEVTSVYGQAVFDADGTLFVGISNNTEPDAQGNRTGQMRFAASQDGGQTFAERVFATGDGAVVHFYMDANEQGAGALVVWATEDEDGYDWYVGHLFVGADGAPALEDAALAIDDGPQPSAHVTGAAVGPDGRAYIAMYRPSNVLATPFFGVPAPNHTPLSVFVQVDGPTLPAAVPAVPA